MRSRLTKAYQVKWRISPGFTLVELLIGLFILQLIMAPLYLMFTSTKRTMYKAADTLAAANLASSLLAGLRELPAGKLRSQPQVIDSTLSEALSLENLGVLPAPHDFTREVEIMPVSLAGQTDDNLYLVEVKISWFNRNTTTAVSYIVRDVLQGAK